MGNGQLHKSRRRRRSRQMEGHCGGWIVGLVETEVHESDSSCGMDGRVVAETGYVHRQMTALRGNHH